MIEIAISLAIIGFALVAIIGVLPLGMNTQRDNREETVINQDATVLLEVIRGAARGADNLTNSVYAVTNTWTHYKSDGSFDKTRTDGYTYPTASFDGTANDLYRLTNGANIVGVLTIPEFTDDNFAPTNNLFSGGYSNHIIAYVRSISGLAAEKPPQNNQIMQEGTFTYRLFCVNAPVAVDTNLFALPPTDPRRVYADQLSGNLHELRLTFLWPQLPNGNLGPSRQTFRTTVAGQLTRTNYFGSGQQLYFYRSQSFTNAP
jgi:type II secretory pathway pseudopilin PulG